MRELTIDADVLVVAREIGPPPVVVYERVSTGERWRVTGICNQCGLCAIGAVGDWYVWDGPAGTPYSNRDTRVPGRLDEPLALGFLADMEEMARLTPTATVTGCSLRIETESV